MERRLGLTFTTLMILAPLAQASPSPPASAPESRFEFFTSAPGPRGFALARQVVPAAATTRAQSRVLYLNRAGAILSPGDNDSSRQRSSVVSQATRIRGWDTDDATWEDTVACIADLYGAFDVTVTEDDPGDAPHIEAVFGGHPSDVGLPDNVGGISPFATDCGIVERSIVFAFTEALPDDARTICEVMAQEIAHSFGLDHELLPSDPMTYLDYAGERAFQDEDAACGEFERRPCGVDGHTCWARQNSVQLLTERLGPRRGAPGTAAGPGSRNAAGCAAASGDAGPALALLGLILVGARPRPKRSTARREGPRDPA